MIGGIDAGGEAHDTTRDGRRQHGGVARAQPLEEARRAHAGVSASASASSTQFQQVQAQHNAKGSEASSINFQQVPATRDDEESEPSSTSLIQAQAQAHDEGSQSSAIDFQQVQALDMPASAREFRSSETVVSGGDGQDPNQDQDRAPEEEKVGGGGGGKGGKCACKKHSLGPPPPPPFPPELLTSLFPGRNISREFLTRSGFCQRVREELRDMVMKKEKKEKMMDSSSAVAAEDDEDDEDDSSSSTAPALSDRKQQQQQPPFRYNNDRQQPDLKRPQGEEERLEHSEIGEGLERSESEREGEDHQSPPARVKVIDLMENWIPMGLVHVRNTLTELNDKQAELGNKQTPLDAEHKDLGSTPIAFGNKHMDLDREETLADMEQDVYDKEIVRHFARQFTRPRQARSSAAENKVVTGVVLNTCVFIRLLLL